ncbi:MAG: hypothetical protein AB7S74_01755 [Hyphomicrobium sp.]
MSEDLPLSPVQILPGRSAVSYPAGELSERQILRFAPSVRREIRRLIRSSPRAGDLCDTFPGLLYALAARSGSAQSRLGALAAVDAGAPLKVVARTLGLPMWLRRLPPEAFGDISGVLPQSAAFTRQIVHRLPRSTSESRTWLRSILFASEACGEEFAIWLAGQPLFADELDPRRALAILSAYAWHSGRPDTDAFKLIVVPWRPEIALDTALCAAKSWFNRIRLVLQLPSGALKDSWLEPRTVLGFSFEALLDADSLLKEAAAMHNCADQYAERIVRDRCRLFSVKRNGSRVATLEIGQHTREGGVLAINQLKARHNMAASSDVWQAAYGWMASQTGLRRLPPLAMPESTWDQHAWWSLLAPYRNAHEGAPWFDPTASHLVFAGLDADLTDLARRGGVSSWLFT